MKISIIKDNTPKPNNDQIIQEGIISFNALTIKELPDKFSIYLKDENNTIYGGAVVWVHSESIYIDILWIADDLRGQGLGSKIMRVAEEEAKTRGCKYSTVDTYSFQAEQFYLKNGYHKIGEIKNHLFHHSKIFFRKELI